MFTAGELRKEPCPFASALHSSSSTSKAHFTPLIFVPHSYGRVQPPRDLFRSEQKLGLEPP
jgi:hypothetical protein